MLLDGLDEAVAAGLLTEAAPGDVCVCARPGTSDDLRRAQLGAAHAAAPPARRGARNAARRRRARRGARTPLRAGRCRRSGHQGRRLRPRGRTKRDRAARLRRRRRSLRARPAGARVRRHAHRRARAASCCLRSARRAGAQATWTRPAKPVAWRPSLPTDAGDPDRLARAALSFAGPLAFETSAAVTGPFVDLLQRALEALGDSESGLRARVMGRLAVALAYSAPHRRRPDAGATRHSRSPGE